MNFEQILIRLGVDATAVTSGLGRVASTVKAWGVSLVQSMKSSIGRLFLAGAAIEGLNKMKDKILEVARVSKETGANTNFVQGLMQESEKVGLDFHEMTGGIAKFNKLIGEAKMGSASALIKLKDMGIVTNSTKVSTLNFTGAMHNLAIQFDKLNDKQKQAYLLNQAFGKSYAALQPIFERGVGNVDKLSSFNPFTKIGKDAISSFSDVWRAVKTEGIIVGSTLTNILAVPFTAFRKAFQVLGAASAGQFKNKDILNTLKSIDDAEEKQMAEKSLQAAADEEGINVSELKAKILDQQNSLLEKQSELTSEIADRAKSSVEDLANKTRKLMGIKSPKELDRTVTKRGMIAAHIQELEQKSELEWEQGNDSKSKRLQSEADQIRQASPWLKRQDRNPMQRTESELQRVNMQLEPVKRMAELVTKSNNK